MRRTKAETDVPGVPAGETDSAERIEFLHAQFPQHAVSDTKRIGPVTQEPEQR